MDIFLKRSGGSLVERDAVINFENNQQTCLTGLYEMNKLDYERTKKTFEGDYFIAKEELPIVKFESILSLEQKHGIDIGTYCYGNSGGIFIDSISDSLVDDLKSKLLKSHVYSVLTDGSTDSSISENEAVFAVYFDMDEMSVHTSFFKLVFLQEADAKIVM